MSGYTPVFDSVFHGTLCGRWPTLPVWLTILPMADKRGEIDMTYQAMSALTGWPLDLLKQAINELMQPDPESRSESLEGRRLVLIDPDNRSWGWRVVNHTKYREKARKSASDAERSASGENRQRMAERRPAMTRDDPRPPTETRDDRPSDSDADSNTDKDKDTSAATPPERVKVSPVTVPTDWFLDFKIAYPDRDGDQKWRGAQQAANARIAEGHTTQEFIEGAKRYASWCKARGKVGTEGVKQACTFLGPEKPFLLPWTTGPESRSAVTHENREDATLRKLMERRDSIGLTGFRDARAGETADQYRRAQDDEWNKRKASAPPRAIGETPLADALPSFGGRA